MAHLEVRQSYWPWLPWFPDSVLDSLVASSGDQMLSSSKWSIAKNYRPENPDKFLEDELFVFNKKFPFEISLLCVLRTQ